MAKRTLALAELKAECTVLERAVRSAGLASEEELALHRPGGEQNSGKDVRGWLRYFAVLHRRHGRLESSGEYASKEDALVLDALRAEPVTVTLMGEGDRTIAVYPKGLDAALHIHALDLQLAWLMEQKNRAEATGNAEYATLLPKIYDAISYTYKLLCWILTTPGPAMPYGTEDQDPVLPPYVNALEPWDVMRICRAQHQHLNRLKALSALVDESPQNGGTRPSWSMFVGSMAVELKESAPNLMKFRSLAELLALARLHAGSRSAAEEAA